MYKICKTDKSLARQRAFEYALMKELQKNSLKKISVDSLCRQTGISRNSFYRYFPTKEDALIALIDHTLMDSSEDSVANWNGGSNRELSDLENFFLFWQEKKDFLDALTANNCTMLLLERCSVLYDETNTSQGELSFAEEEARYTFLIGMISAMLRWYRRGFPASAVEMAVISHNLFSDSFVEMKGLFL